MKKVLSLLLAFALVAGISATAFAADGTYTLGLSGSTSTTGDDVGTIRPGDELNYYLYLNGANVTRATVRDDKLDVKIRASEGRKVVDDFTIKYDSNNNAYVKVEFIDPFVSTKEQDFSFTLYLTKNKSRISDAEITVTGTFENDEQFVDENDDFVYLYDTPVVEAEGYVKSIEVDLGDGISIFTRMFDGKRYYGYVTQEITASDDEIVSKYPAIDTVYNLSTINLNSAGNYTKFDIDEKMYVYNADLEYIGTTNDKLPYSTKYYLASVELDVASDDYDTIPSDGGDTDNVPSGGDDVPANVNQNPGTGR